jgi:hypothetical protein
LSDKKIARQHDKVKTNKKEDCLWKYLQQLVQKSGPDSTYDPGRNPDRLGRTAVIIRDRLGLHTLTLGRQHTHWAGMVTTGAAPLVPVSEIENSNITTANVVFD